MIGDLGTDFDLDFAHDLRQYVGMSRYVGVQGFFWLVDQITAIRLFGFVVLFLTLLPSWIYVELSRNCSREACTNGLASEHDPTISFGDAMYFSVITESTLGYGDIHPRGWSRLLACLQVVLGLAVAGISVAKITSLPNQELRMVGRKASGTWLAMNYLHLLGEGEQDIVTKAEIKYDGRTISYWGTNYTLQAEPCGQFNSDLMNYSGRELRFKYTNGDSVTRYFT